VSYGSRPRLLAEVGSGAATCPAALDPASLLGRAPALSCVPRHRILPSCSRGLRRSHVSHGTGPRLPAREGSGAAMYPTILDPAFLLGRALTLPRVLRHRIPPPCSGGLRRYHVSHGFGSYLPALESSGGAAYPTAPDPASLLGRAPTLPCVLQLCGPHTSRIKKVLDGLPMRLDSRVSMACLQVSKACDIRAIMGLQDVRAGSAVNACKACRQVATMRIQCSASTMDHTPGTAIVPSDLTSRCHTADRVQRGRQQDHARRHR
jgi:hypothetical protein